MGWINHYENRNYCGKCGAWYLKEITRCPIHNRPLRTHSYPSRTAHFEKVKQRRLASKEPLKACENLFDVQTNTTKLPSCINPQTTATELQEEATTPAREEASPPDQGSCKEPSCLEERSLGKKETPIQNGEKQEASRPAPSNNANSREGSNPQPTSYSGPLSVTPKARSLGCGACFYKNKIRR